MNPFNVIYPDLKGKTVIVTGAGKGIGKSIAEGFIANQCKVIALYRSIKPDFKNIISKTCPQPEYLHVDIQEIDRIKTWLNDLEKTGRSVDILINNAGVNSLQSVLDITCDEWDQIFSINLKSTFFLAQLFANHMKLYNGGVIINATSFAAIMPSIGYGVYAASKAALLSLTKSMAAEWAPFNIRVNAFSPGVIETEMTRTAITKNKEHLISTISQRKIGSTNDVAKVVLFLSSNESSYLTGTEIDISGGKYIVQNPPITK